MGKALSEDDSVLGRLRADLRRLQPPAAADRPRANSLSLLTTPGCLCVVMRRAQEGVLRAPLVGRALRRLLWWWSSLIFGSEIALAAEIGGGFYLPHPYGVVVGACHIGRNVTLMQNVTLGRRHPHEDAYPTLEADVVICAGAVVLGGVVIGKGAVIGANAVVLSDVPPGATAIGNPARIIERKPQ